MKLTFKCESVTKYVSEESVTLVPFSSDVEYSFDYPSGRIELALDESHSGVFVPGKQYVIDIQEEI